MLCTILEANVSYPGRSAMHNNITLQQKRSRIISELSEDHPYGGCQQYIQTVTKSVPI